MTRSLPAHRRLRACSLLAGLVALGCRADVAPAWIPLARGFRPPPGADLARAWNGIPGPLSVRGGDAEGALTLVVELAASAWRATDPAPAELHEWSAPCPLLRTLQSSSAPGIELELDEALLTLAPDRAGAEQRARAGEAAFFHQGPRLVLLRASPEPPGPGTFACRVERGREQHGLWRAALQEIVADGLALWPGETWSTEVDVPPGSALRFTSAARSLGRAGRVLFRVTRDGETLFEHAQTLSDAEPGTFHVLPLASAGSARLVFEVRGDPGLTAFLQPWIGPHEVGAPALRPWPDARPNVVFFLADTFRADLLEAGGGSAHVTPNLNRLAARALSYSRARSPSTWTLPAHASLFTGLFPTQHGALDEGRTFAPALETLAERLARAGYRTGAVTDSGFLSRQYGLDRGFEWFLEHTEALGHRLAKTLRAAREFLAHDDGRPVFLFVHTYRTHWPYRTGSGEDRSAHDALVARFSAGVKAGERPAPEVLAAFGGELAELYREGASALDEELGPWFDELERSGIFDPGYFVFTSDHGEAFFEHGKSEHRGLPFEEELRVPLFLLGPGLEPRRSAFDASLLDLAPTLAELCGLAPDPDWCGESLLAPESDRLVFAWQGAPDKETIVIVAGRRKVFLPASTEAIGRGEARIAFDLGLDPAERENLVKRGAAWPGELVRSAAPELAPLSRLVAGSTEVEISAWLKEELEKLGYAGTVR